MEMFGGLLGRKGGGWQVLALKKKTTAVSRQFQLHRPVILVSLRRWKLCHECPAVALHLQTNRILISIDSQAVSRL